MGTHKIGWSEAITVSTHMMEISAKKKKKKNRREYPQERFWSKAVSNQKMGFGERQVQ